MVKGFVSRRASDRVDFQTNVGIQFAVNEGEPVTATTTNLSADGVRFYLPRGVIKLAPEEVVELIFNIPNHSEIVVAGDISYFSNAYDADRNPVIYYGVKFRELSENDWIAINDFVQSKKVEEEVPQTVVAPPVQEAVVSAPIIENTPVRTEPVQSTTIQPTSAPSIQDNINSNIAGNEESFFEIPSLTPEEAQRPLNQDSIDQLINNLTRAKRSKPEPIPVLQPVVETKPEPIPVLQPVVETKPEPIPVPQPVVETKPEPIPVLQPVVETIPEPIPVPQPVVETKPEPIPVLQPVVETIPEPITVLQPVVEIKPEPIPVPQPVVETKPEPIPVLQPVVETKPEPIPVLQPVVETKPEPIPVPQPVVETITEPIPVPQPVVETKPEPIPAPQPVVETKPEPIPASQPVVETKPEPIPNNNSAIASMNIFDQPLGGLNSNEPAGVSLGGTELNFSSSLFGGANDNLIDILYDASTEAAKPKPAPPTPPVPTINRRTETLKSEPFFGTTFSDTKNVTDQLPIAGANSESSVIAPAPVLEKPETEEKIASTAGLEQQKIDNDIAERNDAAHTAFQPAPAPNPINDDQLKNFANTPQAANPVPASPSVSAVPAAPEPTQTMPSIDSSASSGIPMDQKSIDQIIATLTKNRS